MGCDYHASSAPSRTLPHMVGHVGGSRFRPARRVRGPELWPTYGSANARADESMN